MVSRRLSPCLISVIYWKDFDGETPWNKTVVGSAADGQWINESFSVARFSSTMCVGLPLRMSSNNNRVTAVWIYIGFDILEFN